MVSPTREPRGAIEQLDALLADIQRAHNRGEDIGMREYDRIARENQLAAWRSHQLYHCLGPRNGAAMPDNWFGDPTVPHEPATEQAPNGFHPACSCGFRAILTSDTEEGALRRARVHAQVSTPQPQGRYVLTAYDRRVFADFEIDVHLYCREHGPRSLLEINGAPDEHQEEIAQAMRTHDREHHEAHDA